MTQLAHEPSRTERAIERLPWAWRAREVFRSVMETLIEGAFQPLEDDIYALAMAYSFRTPEGWFLNFLGNAVGEEKGALTTAEYRAIVRGKFLARRCTGQEDELIELWKELTQAEQAELFRFPRKAIELVAWRREYMRPIYAARAARIMREAAPICAVRLTEALTNRYLGFGPRDRDPIANPIGLGIPARRL